MKIISIMAILLITTACSSNKAGRTKTAHGNLDGIQTLLKRK